MKVLKIHKSAVSPDVVLLINMRPGRFSSKKSSYVQDAKKINRVFLQNLPKITYEVLFRLMQKA